MRQPCSQCGLPLATGQDWQDRQYGYDKHLACEAIPYAGKYFDDKWGLSEQRDELKAVVLP